MMRKTFGQFESPQEVNPTGSQTKASTPPIMGAPMPNAGMKNQNMGNVSPPKDKPSPKQFAQRQDAGKRLKKMPDQSPLGPITGGPTKPQARPQARPQMQKQQQEPVGTGDRWMGELWQGLTLNDQPQGGFAMGGKVGNSSNPGMDLYNKVTMELEAGGIGGYAEGGMVEKSREIASKGRNGDTMLMHIQPQELQGLQSLLGPLTINPETGNPEAFILESILATALLTGGGAGIGALAGGKEGAAKGALIGLGIGAGGAAAAGFAGAGAGGAGLLAGTKGAGGVTAGTGPLAASTPAVGSQIAAGKTAAAANLANLTGASTTLAPGAGVLAPGYGGGVMASQIPAGLTGQAAIDATMKAGMSGAGLQPAGLSAAAKKGLAKAGASGLSSLMSQSESQQQAPPPSAPPPPPAAPNRREMPSPEEIRRRRMMDGKRSGIAGSGRII